MVVFLSIAAGILFASMIFFWLIFEERKAFICLFFLILTILLMAYLPKQEDKEDKPPVQVKQEVCEIVPDHVRIKRRCGIPDSVEWSDKMRLVYGKQIEKVINSFE